MQVEAHDVEPERRRCPACGDEYRAHGSEDSEQLEIEVRAYRRVIKRRRYRRSCQCAAAPALLTAAAPPRLIPKGILGISVWVTVLIDKYLLYRPTYRLLADLRAHGLDLAQGTVTDGMRRLAPLFAPLREALIARSRTGQHWHADETRWQVFEADSEDACQRWCLWVFWSAEVVVFTLDPTRSARVPKQHFATVTGGVVSVDRYSAYKRLAKDTALVLSFCWVHMRRDFITIANERDDQEEWADRPRMWRRFTEMLALHSTGTVAGPVLTMKSLSDPAGERFQPASGCPPRASSIAVWFGVILARRVRSDHRRQPAGREKLVEPGKQMVVPLAADLRGVTEDHPGALIGCACGRLPVTAGLLLPLGSHPLDIRGDAGAQALDAACVGRRPVGAGRLLVILEVERRRAPRGQPRGDRVHVCRLRLTQAHLPGGKRSHEQSGGIVHLRIVDAQVGEHRLQRQLHDFLRAAHGDVPRAAAQCTLHLREVLTCRRQQFAPALAVAHRQARMIKSRSSLRGAGWA